MGRTFGKALVIFAVFVLVFPALVISSSPKWVYPAANKYIFLSQGSDEKTLYFATGSGVLVAINKSNGRTLWQIQAGSAVYSEPLYSLGKIYVFSYEGNIQAIDTNTKSALWTSKIDGKVWGSSPRIYKDLLFIGSENGKLTALNKSDGRLVWESVTGGPIRSSPLVYGGRVFVGSDDGKLYAFEAETGKKAWEFKAEGSLWTSSPAGYLSMIFFGSVDGNLYSVTADKGKLLGTFKTGGWVASSPIAPEGTGFIYFGSNDGYFYSLDAQTMEMKWKFKSGGPIQGTPRAIQTSKGSVMLYFGSNDGSIYALRAATGTPIWNFSASDWVMSPYVEGRFVYFSSYEGKVYAVSTLGCNILYPRQNFSTSENYLVINGTGSSTEGLRNVKVRLKGGDWRPVQGTTEWSTNLSLESLSYGSLDVECMATDSAGIAESPPYTSATFIRKEYVPPKEMQIESPKEANVEQKIRIKVIGDDGAPLSGAILKVGATEYVTGEDGAVDLAIKEPGKRKIAISREGYFSKEIEIELKQEISLYVYLYAILAVFAVIAVVIGLKRRKK